VQQIKPSFPVGHATRPEVIKYLGRQTSDEIWVPVLIFIDKQGFIRYTHYGNDQEFQGKNAEPIIRRHIEELLK
jgi:hypothetical protein